MLMRRPTTNSTDTRTKGRPLEIVAVRVEVVGHTVAAESLSTRVAPRAALPSAPRRSISDRAQLPWESTIAQLAPGIVLQARQSFTKACRQRSSSPPGKAVLSQGELLLRPTSHSRFTVGKSRGSRLGDGM